MDQPIKQKRIVKLKSLNRSDYWYNSLPVTQDIYVMTLLYPQALFLLILVVPIVFWSARTFSHLSAPQKLISLLLRISMLLLLVLALGDARWRRTVDRMGVMFVVDVSDSIPADERDRILTEVSEALKSKPKDDLAGIVLVGRDAAIEEFPSSVISPSLAFKREAVVGGNFTNLADGLKLASASLPSGIQKRIVLYTDGAENLGDVLSEAEALNSGGVEFVTVPISPEYGDEAEVQSIFAPAIVGEGETVGLRMVLSSTRKQKTRVILAANGNYIGETIVELDEGKNVFSYPIPGLESGFHSFAVTIEPKLDTTPENNTAFAFSRVTGRAGVLIAGDDPSDTRSLDAVLESHKLSASRLGSRNLPLTLPEWLSFDTIVFSAIPAHNLSEEQMEQIATATRDFGHGFVMLGGEDSFGPGGYYKTAIEDVLPVTMDFKRHAMSPNVAMLLLVDRSGSMAVSYGGYEKLALAREACISVVELVEPNDYVGVMTFDSLPKWVVQPAKNVNREAAISRIRSIVAGGGTEIYPSLVEAEKALAGIDAKIKHVILLSDGMSAPGDFTGIVSKLVAGGATVTTVGIGDDADLQFMAEIAQMGGGNTYFTSDPYDLPRIFTRETFLANKGTIVEQEFAAVPSSPNPLIEGISWETAPPLLGYVATSEKPTADTALLTPMGDPLFSIWRYGLGRSAAFTSDAKNRWASQWLNWEGYSEFWSSLMRSTSASAASQGYRARADLEGDRGVVSLELLDEARSSGAVASAEARIVAPDMSQTSIPMQQTAVGKFMGEFPIAENGTYLVNVVVSTDDGVETAAAGLAVSYSPEYKKLGADTFILEKLQEISVNITPVGNTIFTAGRIPQIQHHPAWELLLLIALYLWILDIAVRRVMWNKEYLNLAGEAWSEYTERVKAARVRRGQLRENISAAKLLERSRQVRQNLGSSVKPESTSAPPKKEKRVSVLDEIEEKDGEVFGEVSWHKPVDQNEIKSARESYSARSKGKFSKLGKGEDKDERK